jgi:hypothetical protein
VRVWRQAVVGVIGDAMMALTGQVLGVHVHDGVVQVRQPVQQPVPRVQGDRVGLGHGAVAWHGDVELNPQTMS